VLLLLRLPAPLLKAAADVTLAEDPLRLYAMARGTSLSGTASAAPRKAAVMRICSVHMISIIIAICNE